MVVLGSAEAALAPRSERSSRRRVHRQQNVFDLTPPSSAHVLWLTLAVVGYADWIVKSMSYVPKEVRPVVWRATVVAGLPKTSSRRAAGSSHCRLVAESQHPAHHLHRYVGAHCQLAMGARVRDECGVESLRLPTHPQAPQQSGRRPPPPSAHEPSSARASWPSEPSPRVSWPGALRDTS